VKRGGGQGAGPKQGKKKTPEEGGPEHAQNGIQTSSRNYCPENAERRYRVGKRRSWGVTGEKKNENYHGKRRCKSYTHLGARALTRGRENESRGNKGTVKTAGTPNTPKKNLRKRIQKKNKRDLSRCIIWKEGRGAARTGTEQKITRGGGRTLLGRRLKPVRQRKKLAVPKDRKEKRGGDSSVKASILCGILLKGWRGEKKN